MARRKIPDPQELADRYPHIPTEEMDRDLRELEELLVEALLPGGTEAARIARDARVREIEKKYGLA